MEPMDERMDEPMEGINALNCAVCIKLQEGTKSLHFARTPKFIFVQLVRFVTVGDTILKKTNNIMCNSKITISQGISAHELTPVTYHLTAIVSHIGSYKGGGHYYFQGRSESGKIFLCDDKTIKENKFFEEQNAYLLLYKRAT